MATDLKIGMIGLDTSHVRAFANLLHDENHDYHVPGGRVTIAYPGGSPDFEQSISRVDMFTNELRDQHNVTIVDSIEEVAEASDVILLESVDGRVHLEQFRKIVPYSKPTFIDKPFATTSEDAEEIARLATENGIPVMSSSALRYAEALTEALNDTQAGDVIGMDCYGPMAIVDTQPGLFWYGVHTVDMLFRALGQGCRRVRTLSTDEHDVVIGEWADGRIGSIRGNRSGNNEFGATLHRTKSSQYVDIKSHSKPYYASLLEHVMPMFKTGQPPVDIQETVQVVRFMEAANESRETGQTVVL